MTKRRVHCSGRRRLLNALPILSILLFVLLWMWASSGEGHIIPSPAEVWARAVRLYHKPINKVPLGGHIWASMKRVLSGLALACATGIPLGLLIGWNKTAGALLKPLFDLIRPIPALSWIPLMTLWFGIGESSKVALIYLGTLMPILVNTYTGVRMIPQLNIDVARVFGATPMQIVGNIVMPSALSAIMAGVKTAMGTGWIVVLAAEMISADHGLGFMIIRGSNVADLALVVFAMLIIGIIGALLSTLLTFAERRLCPWKTDIN